jgi:hypothetical protein
VSLVVDWNRSWLLAALLPVLVMLNGCSTQPLNPYDSETTPLVLMPATQAGIIDRRARFREVLCAVLQARAGAVPDYRPCEEVLARVGAEPDGAGLPVDLGDSRRELIALMIPGVGWNCVEDWLNLEESVDRHVRQFGYASQKLKVDALSGSANNARQIRDAIMQMPVGDTPPRLVLVGYSKGAADLLEAVVRFPEIHGRVAAVVSAGGSVGGSPLANDADQAQLDLLRYWPGAQCTSGDAGAMESLLPSVRHKWLASNPLPAGLRYYSLATFPHPTRISDVLKPTYHKLSRVDARNDGQLLFYDQLIPGSELLAYLNADHWALGVPIARSHELLGDTLVNHNDFPREALVEALLRFIEEEMDAAER